MVTAAPGQLQALSESARWPPRQVVPAEVVQVVAVVVVSAPLAHRARLAHDPSRTVSEQHRPKWDYCMPLPPTTRSCSMASPTQPLNHPPPPPSPLSQLPTDTSTAELGSALVISMSFHSYILSYIDSCCVKLKYSDQNRPNKLFTSQLIMAWAISMLPLKNSIII